MARWLPLIRRMSLSVSLEVSSQIETDEGREGGGGGGKGGWACIRIPVTSVIGGGRCVEGHS